MRRLTLLLAILAGPVSAHEFWLQPEAYVIQPDATLTAKIVNGDQFKGQNIPYLPQRFVNFVAFTPDGVVPVQGRVGDLPALQLDGLPAGLNVLAYEARDSTVTYDSWDIVTRVVEHKQFSGFYDAHAARGFDEKPFTEVYSRYSKSLVAVGDGAGSDQRTGLETEIVALTNPYTDDLSNGMTFQLWYGNSPRGNARFEIWDRSPDGAVTQTFYQTDADGMVTVPVQAGYEYMADAVLYREPTAALAESSGGAIWETLWANMTWKVPAR